MKAHRAANSSEQPPSPFASPLIRWALVLVPGLFLYFVPLGALSPNQQHLLAIFSSAILALIIRPAPMGVTLFLAVALTALTKTLPIERALAGFGSPIVWLIFCAFLLA